MGIRSTLGILAATVFWLTAGGAAALEPLRAIATTPDLGDLLAQVGGEAVRVEVLAKGPQDPHFLEPRPSFVRKLHGADLLVVVGMDLEIGWLPRLLRGARNPAVQPGAPGYLDASAAIAPLEVPSGPVDRSAGDVHPYGNPHYLLDPLNGLRVARLLRDRLAALRPDAAEGFARRYDGFARRLLEQLAGADALREAEPEALAARLESRALPERLGGWLGRARALRGAPVVQDHRLWSYLAHRFGLETVATLEPRPGIAPTTRQLGPVVEEVRVRSVKVILASPYFDPRHARWVAEQTGARVAPLAHQAGGRRGADGYLGMLDYNVRELVTAFEGG